MVEFDSLNRPQIQHGLKCQSVAHQHECEKTELLSKDGNDAGACVSCLYRNAALLCCLLYEIVLYICLKYFHRILKFVYV